MKKILITLIFVLFLGINTTFAVGETTNKSWNKNIVQCDTISDSNGAKYIAKSNYVGWEKSTSGTFQCEKHGFYGGSWTGWINKNTNYSCPDNRFASKIEYSGNQYRIYCKYRDDTPPTASDITISPTNNSYFIANDSKNVHVVIDDNGEAPIKNIDYKYEKYDTDNIYSSLQTENDGEIDKNFNFSNVDNSRTVNGYRDYSFKIETVCDEANNCTTFTSPDGLYHYKVYAANIDYPGNSSITSTDNLSNGTKIADGTINNVQLTLRDKYNNKIIKVTKDDGTEKRNVRVKVNYDNQLFLDQYKQSGTGGVFIGDTNLNLTETPDSGIFKNQTNGIYNLDFKVYSPTTNTYNKAKGSFKINNITAGVSDITGEETFASDIEFKFKPIYKLTFKDEGAKKYGFEEGIPQDGGIEKTKNGTSTTSSEKIYFEFGKTDGIGNNEENTDFNLTMSGSTINSGKVVEGYQINIDNLTEQDFNNFDFITKLEQENTAVESYDLTYLASFVKYKIDGKTIAYPTDIIGKMTYSSGTGTNTRTLEGIKVLGKTHSEKAQEIFKNQEKDINKVAGKIDKSFVRRIIRQNAYNLIKNLDTQYYTNTDNNYKKLGNIIFYKLNGGNIKYSAIQSDYKAKSGKTILIEGGNLIIEKNDLNSPINGIHGIVVLKNIEGKGGEILVDEDVLNINATIYADKALFAYDSSKNDKNNDGYLDLDDDGIGYFKNQLYIKGTLFSNNTIGGARGDDLKCAYYETGKCDTKKAQKYDLNFIRRYYRYLDDMGTPDDELDDEWKVAEDGSSSPGIPDKYLDYPLVIQYNPLIQTTPPPLFEK